MTDTTTNPRILIISTSYGTEAAEIQQPLERLREAGMNVTVATTDGEDVQTLVGDKDPGPVVPADTTLDAVQASDFDVLIVPGGTLNADTLRQDERAQKLVKAFGGGGKPVAAICHAPWLLVDSDLTVGRTVTSYPSLRTDINNAGGNWVDQAVVVDEAEGFPVITSRTPDDLDEFIAAIVRSTN